jgi:hypothetical protein
MTFLRACPQCSRDITYKSSKHRDLAQSRRTLCKSCNTRNVQATWSAEKRLSSIKKTLETKKNLPDDVKHATIEKIKQTNRKTWQNLPQAFVKNCLENPQWHAKLSAAQTKPCSEKRRRAIIEAKVGMPYEEWLCVRSAYQIYAMQVRYVTEQQPLDTLLNHELRGNTSYHLDHKFSVIEGFRNGILPVVIGNIINLEYITAKENLTKRAKCSLSIDELLRAYEDYLHEDMLNK